MINSNNYHLAVSILTELGNIRLDYFNWILLISGLVNEFGPDLALRILHQFQHEEEKGEFEYKVKHPIENVSFGTVINIGKKFGWKYQKYSIPRMEYYKPEDKIGKVFDFSTINEYIGNRNHRKFHLSINSHVRNKTSDFNKLNMFFKPVQRDISGLISDIKTGYAFCCADLKRVNKIISRRKENWNSASLFAIDIDDGMTIEEALSMKTTQQALFLYTTCSHTIEKHRFRIVFDLPYLERDPDRYNAIVKSFIKDYGADKSCSDICRVFFGNTEAHIIVPWRVS